MSQEDNPEKLIRKVNLLLLGATGVGKSTFINGIGNYLSYSNLDDAFTHTSINLVPLQFEETDDHCNGSVIQLGNDDGNEHMEAGRSFTQGPRTYTFLSDDIQLRCIDTPGIGDVRGKDQDKANFESIMSHINYLNKINGICILLDPHNSRLTEYFVFCIDELLMHLHKDACKNIVFLFSKSRYTDYKPGDSFPTLKQLIRDKNYHGISLKKDTVYCIDNESIRLLAKRDKGFNWKEKEKTNCVSSWHESCKEISRLLNYVSSIEPHSIKSTVCLNKAQKMIMVLVEPIIKICENIGKNINVLQNKNEEASDWGDDVSTENFRISKIILKCETINPRMVCAGKECVNYIMLDGAHIVNYGKCCHEDCYITGLRWLNKIPALNRFCRVMKDEICTKCSCSWKIHKHITCSYEEKVMVEENDQTKVLSIVEFKSYIKKKIQAQRDEQDKIIAIAANLGIFLDQNSFLANSDVIEGNIKDAIDFEENVIISGGSKEKKMALISLLMKYDLEKKQLISSGKRFYPQDVKILKKSLYSLTSGPSLKEFANVNKRAYGNNCIKSEITLNCKSAISFFGM